MSQFKPSLPPFRKNKIKVFNMASKTGQFIFQIGELDALRKKSQDISVSKITSKEYKQKFEYIKSCLKKYRKITGVGRGITAIQIGIPERFSVVYWPGVKSKSTFTPEQYLIIINPKIKKSSRKKLIYPEMCMSANPIIAPVVRPAWIEFSYYNDLGNLKYWTTKDDSDLGRILNRVFQHEIDHMNGIINIDKVKSSDLILESDPKYYTTAKFKEV